MESKSHAIIAGIFAIVLAALATGFALWLGKDEIQRTPYTIATKLKVSGLNVQAAVRYKGIKVGKVTDIDFDTKTPGQLLLSLVIISDTPITKSTYATLGYQGVTGIAYIELDDDGSQPAAIMAEANGNPRIPLRPGLLQDLETRGMAILGQTEELGKRLNTLLDADNRNSLFNTVNQIGRTAAAWEGVPAKLDPLLAALPATLNQARESFVAFGEFSNSAKNTSAKLNRLVEDAQGENGSMAKLTRTVDQLSNSVQHETLANINNMTLDARTTLRSINRAAENLSERPQSILFGTSTPTPGPGEPGFNNKSSSPASK